MTLFISCATLLVLVTVFFLTRPLWRAARSNDTPTEAANLTVLRSQMAELALDHRAGQLSDADFALAQTELQQRLLNEGTGETPPTDPAPASPATAYVLMGLIPLLAFAAYHWLGQPQALDPSIRERPQEVTQAQIEGMVARLAARLKQNPTDTQGWLMLARSYHQLDRLPEAADAYSKVEGEVAKNPDLLTDYAEVLGTLQQSFKGKPTEMIKAAIALDPNHPRGLLLAGVAAMERRDTKAAIAYWERLLPLLEPGSEAEAMIRGALAKLKNPSTKDSVAK